MATTHLLNYQLRPGLADRLAIGLLALSTVATVEAEWRNLLALDGVEFYVGCVPCDPKINPATLMATEYRLSEAARALIPGCTLDVLAYGCTAASLLIGESRVVETLHAARAGKPVSPPLTAAKAALETLATHRIALLTPYIFYAAPDPLPALAATLEPVDHCCLSTPSNRENRA